ncbi:hypothetical protein B0H12DRAFT_1218416 [Mycena haematopus]|nr:hypothetical protein B0H12DRAFT_1218416 [Mycena haematopus]
MRLVRRCAGVLGEYLGEQRRRREGREEGHTGNVHVFPFWDSGVVSYKSSSALISFLGNKSFVAFSNLNDTESLTKTWKVCTKVASYLEQGQRLENLSWRLWHLQNLMVDTDNAKSKREFKKLSKCMGDKLDKEKGRSIETLPAPDFKRNPSTDLIRQRAVEKERTREASVQGPEHIIQRMQFTFAVEPAASSSTSAGTSTSTSNAPGTTTSTGGNGAGAKDKKPPTTITTTTATKRKRPLLDSDPAEHDAGRAHVLRPRGAVVPRAEPRAAEELWGGGDGVCGGHSYMNNSTSSNSNNSHSGGRGNGNGGNGNGNGGNGGGAHDMRIARPTIELPLDELLNAEMDGEGEEYIDEYMEEDIEGDGDGEDYVLQQEGEGEGEEGSESSGSAHRNSNSNNASGNGGGGGGGGGGAEEGESWMEMGWDELIRGGPVGGGAGGGHGNIGGMGGGMGMGGFDVYHQESRPAFDVPLTLDPHAAFAHHFHNQNQHHPHGHGTKHGSGAGQGEGGVGPQLSPNVYFLEELEEHEGEHEHERMELDGGHQQRGTPTSSSPGNASSNVNANAYKNNTTGYKNTPSANTAYKPSTRRDSDDDPAEFDPDAESSDDGGDDSADSDFFELSKARRRGRHAHAWGGEGEGRRETAAGGECACCGWRWGRRRGGGGGGRRPVLSVRVPVRGAGGGGGGQGMRPPAEVPVRDREGVLLSGGGVGGVMHPNAHANSSSNSNSNLNANGNGNVNLNGNNSNANPNGNGNGNANSAPGGVKAECSNCGATHTPLWRRGLNDELNCNACGLYCKLHKRPRPKTMRNNGGGPEGRGQSVRAEAVDVMAQCYNCHTTATPLWRKDDEGKTVCNACGLYYKLHGSARPISMKSDIIRKRSRHDARRGGASASVSETPTASPGVSRRASPAPNGPTSSASTSGGRASPTLAPDSTTTTHSYDTPSELSSALGPKPPYGHPYPYHEQYPDALPFASVDVSNEADGAAQQQQRANKRRRMSIDSASEPPSSAVSYSSYADGYTSASSQFSMEFPFSRFPNVGYNDENGGRNGNGGSGGGAGLRGGGGANAFWHPPMMLQGDGPNASGNSPGGFLHPPMLPTPEDAPMDYLHPPMVLHGNYHQQDEESLNNFFGGFMQSGLHPPMLPGDDGQMMGMGMAHPPMMPYEDMYDSNGNMLH